MTNIQLLKQLVKQNSYTENKKGVDIVGEIITKELLFMERKIYKNQTYGNLLVFKSKHIDKTKPQILLAGHIDTVHKPEIEYPIKIVNNKFYGPGTQDMKGGILIIIETLKKLEQDNKLKNITFICSPDEETGSNAHKKRLYKLYNHFKYALVFEPTLQFESAFNSTPNIRSIVTSRKGVGRASLEIFAPGGHSGVIEKKKNRKSAIEEAAHKILEIKKLANYKKGTTTNIGLIHGGTALNAIPEYCKLDFDYRVETKEEEIRIQYEFENLINSSINYEVNLRYSLKSADPVMPITKERKQFANKIKSISKHIGIKLYEEHRGGTSDANQISQFCEFTLDGFGVQGDGEHTKNEFLYLDTIEPGIDLAYHVIDHLNMIV